MNRAKEPNIRFVERLGYSQRRCLVLLYFSGIFVQSMEIQGSSGRASSW